MPTFLKDRKTWLIVLGVAVAAIALAAFNGKLWAADKGGPAARPAAESQTVASWTGFGLDVHGALPTASADFGAPVNLTIGGQMAGVSAFYNHQFGVIVLGADVGYDRVWGDLHTFGVDSAVTTGLRAGVLATSSTLVYARGEWLRAMGSGNHVDGWGLGGGIEVRMRGTPVALALEYMHDWMDQKTFGPGIDVTADRVTARLKFDLYSKPVQTIFAD